MQGAGGTSGYFPVTSRGSATPTGLDSRPAGQPPAVADTLAAGQNDNVENLQTQFDSLRQKYGATDSVSARALLVDSMTPLVKQLDAIHAKLSQSKLA